MRESNEAIEQSVEETLAPLDLVNAIVPHSGQVNFLCLVEKELAFFIESPLHVLALREDVKLALGVASIRAVAEIRATDHTCSNFVVLVEPGTLPMKSPVAIFVLKELDRAGCLCFLKQFLLVYAINAWNVLLNCTGSVKAVCSRARRQNLHFAWRISFDYLVYELFLKIEIACGKF